MGAFEKGKPLPGTKWIAGDEIGRGGMGIVLHVSKPPAITGTAKIITPELARRPEFRARFFEEARIQATLKHKNITAVLDYDTLEDGTPFFVMERLRGKTLGQILREGYRPEPSFIHDTMVQLLEGLYVAHTHVPTIVHRDIKPENVFVHIPEYEDPLVKILDFGIAKLLDGKGRDKGLYGTLGFAAPEQLGDGEVTPGTDLFAAGLLLYTMLAGHGPFDHYGDARRIARALLEEKIPSILEFAPWLPLPVVEVLDSALSKNPAERPRDAYHFISQIFALTWASGDPGVALVNTTSPDARTMASSTLGKLIDDTKTGATVTSQGMLLPPVEGETLEEAPHDVQEEARAYLAARAQREEPVAATRSADLLQASAGNRERLGLRASIVAVVRRWMRGFRMSPVTEPLDDVAVAIPPPPSSQAVVHVRRRASSPTERLEPKTPLSLTARAAPTREIPARVPSANEAGSTPSVPGGTSRSIARRSGPVLARVASAGVGVLLVVGVFAFWRERRVPSVMAPTAPVSSVLVESAARAEPAVSSVPQTPAARAATSLPTAVGGTEAPAPSVKPTAVRQTASATTVLAPSSKPPSSLTADVKPLSVSHPKAATRPPATKAAKATSAPQFNQSDLESFDDREILYDPAKASPR